MTGPSINGSKLSLDDNAEVMSADVSFPRVANRDSARRQGMPGGGLEQAARLGKIAPRASATFAWQLMQLEGESCN